MGRGLAAPLLCNVLASPVEGGLWCWCHTLRECPQCRRQ